jgi:hypothetical protein
VPVAPSKHTPVGELKLAEAPTPFAKAATPLPAKVVTAPLGVTLRMRWLPVSARYATFSASKARPLGTQKLAPAPTPSAHAHAPLPANVDTSPAPVTLRRRCPLLSHTTSTPVLSNFISCGRAKLAAVPAPSATVYAPLPAKVVTSPEVADSTRTRLPNSSPMYTAPSEPTATPEGTLNPHCAGAQGAGAAATSVALPAAPLPKSVPTLQ